MKKSNFLFLAIIAVAIFSCTESSDKPDVLVKNLNNSEVDYNYSGLNLPIGLGIAGAFNNFEFDPENGSIIINEPLQITDNGAALGRVLFYDENLSLNNTISCGSCHHQELAFTDGLQFSPGFEGNVTHRNTMAFANPISQNNLFWDSRSFSIVDLSLKPVQNHIEMGMENLDYLTEKLNRIEYYPNLFQEAFGDKEITEERISKAMAQFVGSITTSRAKVDNGNLSSVEEIGRDIFFSNRAMCSQCHGGGNFAAQDGPDDPYGGGGELGGGEDLKGTTNIGLDLVYQDEGKGSGSFKIPSLRNIEVTGPYMHDGRFNTLEEVIDHYSTGIKPHADLDFKLIDTDGSPIRMNFSGAEKTALIAFLNTMTDAEMLTDPKYSNPFK